jgi:hypothetical protein
MSKTNSNTSSNDGNYGVLAQNLMTADSPRGAAVQDNGQDSPTFQYANDRELGHNYGRVPGAATATNVDGPVLFNQPQGDSTPLPDNMVSSLMRFLPIPSAGAATMPRQFTSPSGGRPMNAGIQGLYSAAQSVYPNNPVMAKIATAQAMLESGLPGKGSGLARNYNNLFGIKGRGTAGSVRLPTKEFTGGRMVTVPQPFAANNSPADSFAQHARLMQNNRRYQGVLNARSVEEGVNALQKSGYATDPNYGRKILNIINGPLSNTVGQTMSMATPKAYAEGAYTPQQKQMARQRPDALPSQQPQQTEYPPIQTSGIPLQNAAGPAPYQSPQLHPEYQRIFDSPYDKMWQNLPRTQEQDSRVNNYRAAYINSINSGIDPSIARAAYTGSIIDAVKNHSPEMNSTMEAQKLAGRGKLASMAYKQLQSDLGNNQEGPPTLSRAEIDKGWAEIQKQNKAWASRGLPEYGSEDPNYEQMKGDPLFKEYLVQRYRDEQNPKIEPNQAIENYYRNIETIPSSVGYTSKHY